MTTKPFRILVVCTGNVCRSPLADQMFRKAAGDLPPELAAHIVVNSAGTQAPVGSPMSASAASISAGLGLDPSEHRARQLTVSMVEESDLTLVATRAHRQEVARMLPRAVRALFTIREFGRAAEALEDDQLVKAKSPDDLRTVVSRIASRRGYLPMREPMLDDIVDPIGRSERTYKRMADELVPAVENATRVLFR